MEYRLEEIFDLQMGKTPSRSNPEYWDSDDNKWISIADLSKCGKYIEETKEYLSDKAVEESGISLIPENTVIMSFKLSIGKTAITPESMYSNEAIMSFRDKHIVDLLPDYVYYMFSGRNWDEGTNKAVMGKTLNKATLSKIKVKIHPIDEQREIVKILDKVLTVLEARKNELVALDDLTKARFVELFGNPIYNTYNLPVKCLDDLGEWASGGTPSRTVSGYFEGDINWYSAGELNTLFLEGSIEKITEEAIEKSAAKLFKAGSMLVGMYDTAAFKMGILREDSASNQACACITPNEEVNVIWLYYELQLMKEHFLSQRRGVRQKNLNLGMIKGFVVPFAEKDQQNKFAAFVKQVDKSKVEVQRALDETQKLFDSLMQQYFG